MEGFDLEKSRWTDLTRVSNVSNETLYVLVMLFVAGVHVSFLLPFKEKSGYIFFLVGRESLSLSGTSVSLEVL